MSVHVAIVRPPYDRLILRGSKTVECRLTRTPTPPFGCAVPGERVFFKRSAGPFFAVAEIARVWIADRLEPADVESIRKRFDNLIQGDDGYWREKSSARYACLIWLREVRPCTLAPQYRSQNMRAWYTLDDSLDPWAIHAQGPRSAGARAFDIELSAGAIRQRHVRVAAVIERFPSTCIGGATRREQAEPVSLRLHAGPEVLTDVVGPRKMLRWRGWGGWFEQVGAAPGDRLRFTPIGPRAFTVRHVPRTTTR